MILKGYVAFLDPPKVSTAKAIEALQKHGVTVKVLTGDNDLVTRKVCREVGLKADDILLGGKVETMTDDELTDALETTHIFARLSPAHKQRIIRALQDKQHVVGFMGDGINDGFTQLPLLYWPILFLTVLCYVVLTQVVKMWLIRKAWI